MKFVSLHIVLACAVGALGGPTFEKRALPQGIDVSHYQGTINWNTVKANGVAFVFIKATEGTSKSCIPCIFVAHILIWFCLDSLH